MAFNLKKTLRGASLFVFARYPFITALTLLMLLGERASRETQPPFEPKMIYGHLGVFLVTGICMSFDMKRKEAALMHAGQLLVMAYTVFINPNLKYRDWVKIRMSHRIMGVAGYVVLYCYFTMPRPRSAPLKRIGETLVGLYLVCAVYSILESPEDKTAFLKLVPFGNIALYVYALLMGVCALCYLPGFFVFDVTQALLVLVPFATIFFDCSVDYWTKRRGMDFWVQMRLITDNLAIWLGALVYVCCDTKTIVIRDNDETMAHHEQQAAQRESMAVQRAREVATQRQLKKLEKKQEKKQKKTQ